MIELNKFTLDMYEDVVSMYYDFHKEVFEERKIGEKYFFYKDIQAKINNSEDIVVAVDNGTPIGFSICRVDDVGGLTETVYQCDFAYVKPDYRKTRAAYLLYNNAYEYAKELRLRVSVNGRIDNGVDNMIVKHFNLKKTFTLMEGVHNG